VLIIADLRDAISTMCFWVLLIFMGVNLSFYFLLELLLVLSERFSTEKKALICSIEACFFRVVWPCLISGRVAARRGVRFG